MQALFARLGRPVLRGSGKKIRQERRRTFRPERERSADGVGLAIREAIDRAGVMDRAALEAKAAQAAAAETPTPVVAMMTPAAPLAKRKAARQGKVQPEVSVAQLAPKTGRMGKAAKTRVKAEPAAAAVIAAPAAVATAGPGPAPVPMTPVPPAPSPRRPRGPIPLAAWAHAVTDESKQERRRTDRPGFWKALFRIPSEVALVQYARGCRIHRLLIETTDDLPMLDAS